MQEQEKALLVKDEGGRVSLVLVTRSECHHERKNKGDSAEKHAEPDALDPLTQNLVAHGSLSIFIKHISKDLVDEPLSFDIGDREFLRSGRAKGTELAGAFAGRDRKGRRSEGSERIHFRMTLNGLAVGIGFVR